MQASIEVASAGLKLVNCGPVEGMYVCTLRGELTANKVAASPAAVALG